MTTEEVGWWNNGDKRWWHAILKTIICSGPVPKHVAFVMDGNRRFAKTKHLGNVLNGHEKGFLQLAKILEWCQDLGVKEVSVYAFSIENFKRSDDEVNGLMKLAEEKFQRLLDEEAELESKQICFRFYGNTALLSKRLQDLIAKIESATKNFKLGRVNVCMPYTSRDELARSFEAIRLDVKSGHLQIEDIDESVISRYLDSGDGIPVDLLVRTSGEKRLSDFFLWQCSTSHVYFDDVLWPEFGFYNLCKAILSYQYYRSSITKIAKKEESYNFYSKEGQDASTISSACF